MININRERLSNWFRYFKYNQDKWGTCTTENSIELGSSSAIKQKIRQILGYDKENKCHFDILGEDYDLPNNENLQKPSFDLLFFNGDKINYDELFITKLFDALKPNGTLVVFDLNCYLAEDEKFEKFRLENFYRLSGIIYSDNTLIDMYDSVDRHQLDCFIFSKSNSKDLFVKLDSATNPEVSEIHLISNLGKIYNDKQSRFWFKNNYNKSEGPRLWLRSEIGKIFGVFFPTEGNELSEWYNTEFYENIIEDTKLLEKYGVQHSMASSFQNDNKIDNTIITLLSIVASRQPIDYVYPTPFDAEVRPTRVFSTNYLGKFDLNKAFEITYPEESLIRHFNKNFKDRDEFDIALETFEFRKLCYVIFKIIKPNYPNENTDLIFSQIGIDIKENLYDLTNATIDFKEKLTIDGKIIFQLNNRGVLKEKEFEQFRNDFIQYLECIIDFGDKEICSKPSAFIIIGKNKTDSLKLICDKTFDNFNEKRLKIQVDDKSLDVMKSDVEAYANHWKIQSSPAYKVVNLNKKPKNNKKNKERLEINVNINQEDLIKKIDERADQTDKNVNEKHELGKKHVTNEHKKTRTLLGEIINEVKSIKSSQTEIEEKLIQISETVNSYKDEIQNNIDYYIEKVKKWFKNYAVSGDYTKTVLPTSEFLYESLDTFEGVTDFSSFIAYSSQAIEYEIYEKIFTEFHDHIDKVYTNEEKRSLVAYDKGLIKKDFILKELDKIDSVFNRKIKNSKSRGKYTLGYMKKIIEYISPDENEKFKIEYRTLRSLQEFKNFIDTKIEIDKVFFNKLEKFIEIRNGAAHPGEMNKKQAIDYWKRFKELVDLFLDKLKK